MSFHKDDYMDPDVAYLLGLVLVRGSLHESRGTRTLLIEIDFTALTADGITKTYNSRDQFELSINRVRERINELLEVNIDRNVSESQVSLTANFTKNTIAWRNLRMLTQGVSSFRNMVIPDFFFEFEPEIKRELILGVADACGYVRKSNNYYDIHRTYLQINNSNWILPIQLCYILQQDLGVPVQLIQWGHPNVREPNRTDVRPEHHTWAREHQIKIFAEHFEPIGFSEAFEFKNEILKELADYNRSINHESGFCNPKKKKLRANQKKPKHPCEGHELIPEGLRSKHFNTYWQICRKLGCSQKFKQSQLELLGESDYEEEEGENE